MSPGILCMCQRSSQHRGRQDHTFLKINAHTYFFVFKACNIFRGNTFYMIFRLVLQEAFSIQLYSIAYPRSKLPAVWNSFYFWYFILLKMLSCLLIFFLLCLHFRRQILRRRGRRRQNGQRYPLSLLATYAQILTAFSQLNQVFLC